MRLLIFLSSTSAFFNLYQLQALYPWLALKYAASLSLAGWLNMACLLGMMITAPFANSISRGFSPHRTVLFGIGSLALLNLAIGFSESVGMLFAGRLLQGIVLPFVLTSSMAIVGQTDDETLRWRWVSCYVAGTILGSALSRFYPAFAVDLLGWQGGFMASAGLLVLMSIFIAQRANSLLWAVKPEADRTTPYLKLFKLALTDHRLLIAFSVGFGLLYTQSSIFTVLGLSLAQPPLSLDAEEIGMVYLACLPALIAVFVSPMLHNLRRDNIVNLAMVLLLWCSVFLLNNSYPLILLGVCAFSISTYIMQTQTGRIISEARTVPVEVASGLYLTFYYGGGALGAIVSAYAFQQWAWMGALMSVAVIQSLVLILVVGLLRALR